MSTAFQLHNNLSKNAQELLVKAVSYDENKQSSLALPAYVAAIDALVYYLQKFSPTSQHFSSLSDDEKKIVRARISNMIIFLNNAKQRRQSLSSSSSKNAISKTTTLKKLRTYESQPIGAVLQQKNEHYYQRQQQQQPTLQNRRSLPIQQSQNNNPMNNSVNVPPPNINKVNDPLRQNIESEILDASPNVQWDDIYGLEDVKDALNEMIVLPAQRPDLYSGLRAPGKGVLLFGPPGTGKTIVAKAVATNISATFFSISASSLNSKYHGESERLVRTLFQVAHERQPSFIFIDEIDSILGSRSDSEHEASRRLKTEFMVQFDGASNNTNNNNNTNTNNNVNNPENSNNNRVFIMAATNRPQDLDDAVRRRLDRRIYVTLPDEKGRCLFLKKLTQRDDNVKWKLTESDYKKLAKRTNRFSGSDLKALCRETSLMPLRELGGQVSNIKIEDVRACDMNDFERGLLIVRPSSNDELIEGLEKWNESFGSKSMFKSLPLTTKSSKRNRNRNQSNNNNNKIKNDRNVNPLNEYNDASAAADDDDDDDDEGDNGGGLFGTFSKRRVSKPVATTFKEIPKRRGKSNNNNISKRDHDPDWIP